jgi:hypothetical protein
VQAQQPAFFVSLPISLLKTIGIIQGKPAKETGETGVRSAIFVRYKLSV